MEDKFKNKYRTSSARLSSWDYGADALYYITICTHNRLHYFGDIIEDGDGRAVLQKTVMGEVAHNNWLEIPNHFQFVKLDEFVIMPNHIHGDIKF